MFFCIFQRILSVAALLLLSITAVCGPALGQTSGNLPSVQSFFEYPTLSGAKLSPNARYVAMLVSGKSGYMQLGLIDVTGGPPTVIANFDGADILEFHWVNNDRLVFNAGNRNVGIGEQYKANGLYAINRDGTGFRQLVQRDLQQQTSLGILHNNILPWNTIFYGTVPNSDDIYVAQIDVERKIRPIHLLRLDTKTGHATMIDRPGVTTKWVMDTQGVPRAVTTMDNDMESVYYFDPVQKSWRKLAEFNTYSGDGFQPYAFSPDGTLYVLSRNGTDKKSLYVMT